MTKDNAGEPTITDNGHLAGFGASGQTQEETDTEPASEDSALSVNANTAGVDEPPASVRDKDELDEWGGPEEDSADEPPGLPAIDYWLPDDSDTDGEGRTGFLSTNKEVHSFVFGVSLGISVASNGDLQLGSGALSALAGGDLMRLARQAPEKYRHQAFEELPTFLGGFGIGFAVARLNAIGALGAGW